MLNIEEIVLGFVFLAMLVCSVIIDPTISGIGALITCGIIAYFSFTKQNE